MSGGHGAQRAGDPAAPLVGPVSRLAPEAKLVGLVAFLVVVAVTPPTRPWALAAQATVAALVAAAAFTPLRAVLTRLVIDAPLVVLAAVYAVAGHGPHTRLLGLELSRPGLTVGLGVLVKATIGIVAVSSVAASTTEVDTIVGLRRLRVPAWFCDLLALTLGQLGLLRQDLRRLQLAAGVRAGAGWRSRWSVAGRSFGVLFVRSAERLDRLQLALAARGGHAFAAALAAAPAPATSGTSGAGAAVGGEAAGGPVGGFTARSADRTGWVVALAPASLAVIAAAIGAGL